MIKAGISVIAACLFAAGWAMGALASQGPDDAALEAACRATEMTAPDSCPCTIEKARGAGLENAELASLFKDDGHSQPVDQAKYGRFWQVKSQCIADATMAAMGISPGNPLPGVPANMRPGMPLGTPPAAITAGRASAAAQPAAPAAPVPSRSAQSLSSRTATASQIPSPGSPGERSATRDAAFDSAWVFEDWPLGYRVDYRPDGYVIASDKDARVRAIGKYKVNDEGVLEITNPNVLGTFGIGRPLMASGGRLYKTYQARGTSPLEVFFGRRIGPARRDFPASGPQPLGDTGFFEIAFREMATFPGRARVALRPAMLEERFRLASKATSFSTQDTRASNRRYSSYTIWKFEGDGGSIALYAGNAQTNREVLGFPGATRIAMRENEAGNAFELLALGGGRTELVQCTGGSFEEGGGTCRTVTDPAEAFGPLPAGIGPLHGDRTNGAHSALAFSNPALARRIATIDFNTPGFTKGADCGGALYAFDKPIDPRNYEQANALARTGRLVFRSDGRLGGQAFITGIVIDREFVRLEQVAGKQLYRDANGRVEVEMMHDGPELNPNPAGSDRTTVFVVRVGGEETRMPALYTSSC